MEVNYKEVADRIFHRRKELGITQKKLYELTNISKTQISNIENCYSKPSIDTVLKLCTALDITPDYLLLGVKKIDNAVLNRIAAKAQLSTEEQQNLVYEFVKMLKREGY
jgi:transcriptional regulator with XRE-family HTH domain